MTASRLLKAALARFAKQGFDATSMNEIATDVGIKKPSIYAHFRSKDELLLSLVPLLIAEELEHARTTLVGGSDTKQQLLTYLESIHARFNISHRGQFWLRLLFSPPVHLYDEVMEPMHGFMAEFEGIITEALQNSPLVSNRNQFSAETLAINYMSLVDCLQSELLFGGVDKYKRRLKANWLLFEVAIN